MSLVDEITLFIKNIHIAKDKYFNEDSLPMWIREILNTKADIMTLQKAEVRIIRENIPLVINDICDVIRDCKPILALPPKIKCDYCEGRGWVSALKFDNNKNYTGYEVALNCVCGNAKATNMLVMREDASNNHKTPIRDGYYRVFPSVVEKFKYLDKLEANNWRDIK